MTPMKNIGAGLLFATLLMLNQPCQSNVVADQSDIESPDSMAWTTAKAKLKVEVRIDGGKWSKRPGHTPKKGQSVELRVKPIPEAQIRWYLIFADLNTFYENANPPWKPDAYKWVGFDTINYHRIELTQHRDKWQFEPLSDDMWSSVRPALAAAGHSDQYYHGTLGTFRFQAVVKDGQKILRSPGLEDIGDKGISPSVTRLSVRSGEGVIGALSSFYNVPGIFGSVTYQSQHHIGVDCADVLVAAWGQWKRRRVKRNYNVDMVVGKLKTRSSAELSGGAPDKTLTWGKDVKAGDFIAVKYSGARRFQHIGALAGDTDKDGILSAGDHVMHAGPHPLKSEPLSGGGFDGHVAILNSGGKL